MAEMLLGNSTMLTNVTTILVENTTGIITTTSNSTTTSTTTMLPSTTTTTTSTVPTVITTTTSRILSSTTSEYIKSTPVPENDGHSPTSIAFISLVVFIVAVSLIVKIVVSHRKKRADLIGGTARWRISASSASSNSANPGQTGATYLPMGGRSNRALNQQQQPLTNGLDNPGPDRLDWERQFFDDSEATTPSRLMLR